MRSVRLPDDIEKRLDELSERDKRSKSDIIREAVVAYLDEHAPPKTAYELGADLFGKYSSGIGDLSTTYKTRIIEILREKHSR